MQSRLKKRVESRYFPSYKQGLGSLSARKHVPHNRRDPVFKVLNTLLGEKKRQNVCQNPEDCDLSNFELSLCLGACIREKLLSAP